MHELLSVDVGEYSSDHVLVTEELICRPCRPPDHAAENRALLVLARELTNRPDGVLQKVAELAKDLCGADSAGISILEPGGENGVFRCHAAAGKFASNLDGTMQHDASPCGIAITRNSVLLFNEVDGFLPRLCGGNSDIYEGLLVPWETDGKAGGLLWVVACQTSHRFDAEDARLLSNLKHFAAAAWSSLERTRAANELRSEHRTALNLMEDAIEAREAAERASAALMRSEARQAFLVQLGDALRSLPDPINIQGVACRLLGNFLQVSRVTFADIEGDEFVVRTGYESGVAPLAGHGAIAAFGRVALEAYRYGEPIAVSDVQSDPRFTDAERTALTASEIAAFIVVVLAKGERWVGAFGTHSATPRAWTNFELQLVREVADRVWSSIERARAEEALRRSEERLKKAISIDTVGVVFFNLEGSITGANDAFVRMSGYRREDIEKGRASWTEMTAPEFMSATMKSREEFITKGQNTPYEKQYIRPDGTRWWGLFAGRKLTENECVEFVVDIPASKAAEEALRTSEEQFRRAVEDAPIPVIMHAEDGQVLQISRTWTELTGYVPEEIPTLDAWLSRAESIGASSVREHIRRLFRGGESQFDVEIEVLARSGERRLWSFSASAPGALRDRRRFIVGMAVDITERKRAEEILEKQRQELWKALQETECARREAEEAGRAKDHFLAVLSHELRTPLNPVIIATRMLSRRRDLPPGVAEMVEMIQRNIKLEAQFIDELLDLTRIARGKMELQRELMDMHTAVWHAVQVADPDIQGKNQQLVVTLEAQEHRVLGDATRLQQVFWNLLKNASKFTPEHGEIRLRSRNEPGRIVVEVQDTGIGFEPEAAGRIFAAFEQASEAVTREFGGLGLGLAISKASVEAHQGELRAWSAGQNHGATFTVILPLSSDGGSADTGQP